MGRPNNERKKSFHGVCYKFVAKDLLKFSKRKNQQQATKNIKHFFGTLKKLSYL